MGYDRHKWFGNVEVATAKLAGRETTQYVANIYRYYVAYRMAWQARERRAGARRNKAKIWPGIRSGFQEHAECLTPRGT